MIFVLVYEMEGVSLAQDRNCWDADADIHCWPCYRDGFDVPNPTAGEK